MAELLDRKALRDLRLLKRYTLQEVAKALGISTSQLSKYELGITPMRFEFLSRLLAFYGDSIQQVVTRTEDDYRKGD